MLILKRRATEDVVLDEQSHLTVVDVSIDRVKLRLTVPSDVRIERVETLETLDCDALLVPCGDTNVP